MVDMHRHPAMGAVIARLEGRNEDVEELLGIHAPTEDSDGVLNVIELEQAARDLVDFASFLALEAYSTSHPSDEVHDDFPEHVEHALKVLREIAIRMPLIEGNDENGR